MAKKEEMSETWYLVDLDQKVLGRAATRIATLLRGKHKPTFTPYIVSNDFVIAINADKVSLSGNKWKDKKYYSHSGFPGGIKEVNAKTLLQKHPEDLIRKAVSGMLPNNKLRDHFMKKFKVYVGTEHPHKAQKPEKIEV